MLWNTSVILKENISALRLLLVYHCYVLWHVKIKHFNMKAVSLWEGESVIVQSVYSRWFCTVALHGHYGLLNHRQLHFLFNSLLMLSRRPMMWKTFSCHNLQLQRWAISCRARFQYAIKRPVIRSCEDTNPRDLYLELMDRSEFWQAHRQHCCRYASQISNWCDN